MNFMDEIMARPPIHYDFTPARKQNRPKKFMDLPPKIRVRIYQLLFTSTKKCPENCYGGIKLFATGPRSCDSSETSILRVNQEIYLEALPILWQNTNFLLQMNHKNLALLAYQGSALASTRQHVRKLTVSLRLKDLLDEEIYNSKVRDQIKNDPLSHAEYYRIRSFTDPFLARVCYAIATELRFVEEVTFHVDIESCEEARLWERRAYTKLQQIVYRLNNLTIVLEYHFHVGSNSIQTPSSFYLGTARKWEAETTSFLRGLAWRYEEDLRCPKELRFVARSVFSRVPHPTAAGAPMEEMRKPASFPESTLDLVKPKKEPDWRPRSGSHEENLLRKAEAFERRDGGEVEAMVKDDPSPKSDCCMVEAE